MLALELFSDAANHHALKSVLVALRSKASLKVTLVKRSSASVLPYMTGAALPTPLFAPNEMARLVAAVARGSGAATDAADAAFVVSDAALADEQWLSWESDKLCVALAPLYARRSFTDEARAALKYLDGIVADGRASLHPNQQAAGDASTSSSSSGAPTLADAVVYSSIYPAFCRNGVLTTAQRAEFASLARWFQAFDDANRALVDAAHAELGAAEPADFLRVRPSYAMTRPSERPFYVTTPIYYVNAEPHIGHVYTTLIADTLARYHRLKGERTHFLTGTDEHGQKIAQAAEAAGGMTPKAFTDVISAKFKACFQSFGLEFDHFIRTTDVAHERHVQDLWRQLVASGDIALGSYEGWYCLSDEAYVKDLDVRDGVDRKTGLPCKVSNESGNPVVRLSEDNYVFKLSRYQDRLLKWLNENPRCITPEFRRREIIKFVEGGLLDLSVSRTRKACQWGIPVPGAEADHVIYVWLDALSNYLTYARLNLEDPVNGPLRPWNESGLWPVDCHVLGKDILKFHAVYWPAFLMALGIPPPQTMLAHGWWTKDGEKISKTTGNTFDPLEKAKTYGLDALKFFLLKESSCSDDPDYSDANMIVRLNSELADTLGNLHLRCLSPKLNAAGVWPTPGAYTDRDRHMISHIDDVAGVVDHYFLALNIQRALNAILDALRELNAYTTENEPWRLAAAKKDGDDARLGTVLYVMMEGLRVCFTLLSPVLVKSVPIALDSLGVPAALRSGVDVLKFGVMQPGAKLSALPAELERGLFPKFDAPKSEPASPNVPAVAAAATAGKGGKKAPPAAAAPVAAPKA